MTPHNAAEDAIRGLFEAHAKTIYGLGLRTCGGPDEAEDLVQETFLRAYKGWDKFEGRSNPTTWLYTIAVRACQRMHRKRSGEPGTMQSVEELLPSGELDIVDVPPPDALDDVMREEVRDSVNRAIATLPMDFRMVLMLRDIAGLSVAETSQVLDVKEATVKTRLHRARLLVRKAIAEKLPRRDADPHTHERQACLDLLYAKQEALDRDASFPMPDDELCDRCRAMFTTLDLAHNACVDIRNGRYPESLQRVIDETFRRARAEPGD